MRLSTSERTAIAAVALVPIAALGLTLLPRTLATTAQLCGDSPAPGLCALLSGRAMAAERGPNHGGGPAASRDNRVLDMVRRSSSYSTAGAGGRRQGENAGGAARSYSSRGWGEVWQRLPLCCVANEYTPPGEPLPFGAAAFRTAPGFAPPLTFPEYLTADLPPPPPDPCGGPCLLRGPWQTEPKESQPPTERQLLIGRCKRGDAAACRWHAAWLRSWGRGTVADGLAAEWDHRAQAAEVAGYRPLPSAEDLAAWRASRRPQEPPPLEERPQPPEKKTASGHGPDIGGPRDILLRSPRGCAWWPQ